LARTPPRTFTVNLARSRITATSPAGSGPGRRERSQTAGGTSAPASSTTKWGIHPSCRKPVAPGSGLPWPAQRPRASRSPASGSSRAQGTTAFKFGAQEGDPCRMPPASTSCTRERNRPRARRHGQRDAAVGKLKSSANPPGGSSYLRIELSRTARQLMRGRNSSLGGSRVRPGGRERHLAGAGQPDRSRFRAACAGIPRSRRGRAARRRPRGGTGTPILVPWTNASGTAPARATSRAPRRHGEHVFVPSEATGPGEISSRSCVSSVVQSRARSAPARETCPPSAVDSAWAPKQMPSNAGTPESCARLRSSTLARGIQRLLARRP